MNVKHFFVLGLASLFIAGSVNAATLTLTDKNSTVTIDPNSQAGMNSWTVDGTDHLNQQWFWVGVGGSEVSVDTLALTGAATFDDDFDAGDEVAEISYAGTGFTIELELTLTGSATNESSIGEVIEITNTSSTEPLELRFYQYNDFHLGGTASDISVTITDPPGNTAIQIDAASVAIETAVTQTPDHFEVAFDPTTLTSLNDGAVTTLSDTTGPLGPGDLTWAFQWDFTIGAGDSIVLSKNKSLQIPLPSAAYLAGGLLCGIAARRRRQTV